MNSASFGAWVRKRREDKGWSQRQFAALSGLTNAALSRLERDHHDTHTITTMRFWKRNVFRKVRRRVVLE